MSTDEDLSPEAYDALVDQVSKEAAAEFRHAKNEQEKKLACCRYLKRGDLAGLSHSELIDFLGVSTPSILELAGYSDDEAQEVMDALVGISDDEIENVAI
ncbi:MAG: hypothetical protein NDI75_02620 [Candidatus Didemnitutus sp.]|nr:hypothetical protein [Candidatus Didemnitutus sp.]